MNTIKKISQKLSPFPPLEEDEKDVLYDAESLFLNILPTKTIDYIKVICIELVF